MTIVVRNTRETQIRQRVLVGAVHARVGRKRGQASERRVHLCGGAFEQATATRGEQRVPAEQSRRRATAVIGDVSARVSGHRDDVERLVDRCERDHVAVVEWNRDAGDVLRARSVHVDRVRTRRQQRRHATDVIGVMVRQ
jgi:hypothetical protein